VGVPPLYFPHHRLGSTQYKTLDAEFQGLNEQLANKFPEIHASHQWQTIINYYQEIV